MQQPTTETPNNEGSETSKRLLNSIDIDQTDIQRFGRFNDQSLIDQLAEYAKDPRISSVIKITLAGICGGLIFGGLTGATVGVNEAKQHIAQRMPRPTPAQV